jgi:hypothetical protein
MAVEIWIPEDEKQHYTCRICGTGFPRRQRRAWQVHVGKCVKRAADDIERKVHERDQIEYLSIQDKEKFQWLRRDAVRRKLKGIRGVT